MSQMTKCNGAASAAGCEMSNEGLARRDFLKIAGLGTAAVAASAGAIHAAAGALGLPAEEFPPRGPETHVASMCGLCPARCGLKVRKIGDRAVKVEGNRLDPSNQGGLCPIAQASLQLVYNPDRLRSPLKRTGERGAGRWQAISWTDALALVKGKLDQIRASDGPHTVAFLGGGTAELAQRLSTRLLEAYGSPNFILDTNAAPSHGQDVTQGIEGRVAYDFDNARYVLSFGAPLFEAWMSPVRQMRGIGEFRAGWLGQRGKLVQIESRLSATAARADEWIPVNPGTEGVLALGIANVLVKYNFYNADFVNKLVWGFDHWDGNSASKLNGFKALVLESYDTARVSEITGVPAEVITRLAHEFGHSSPAVAVAAGPRPGSGDGVFSDVAVQCLNAISGSIDKPGGVLVRRDPPLSQWAAVQQDDVARRGLAQKPLHSVSGLVGAIDRGDPYKLNALFVIGSNPLYSSPLLRAKTFDRVPFSVSFSPLLDETSMHADLVLPDCSAMEQYEIRTATPGFALTSVGVASPALAPRFSSRPASQAVIDLAHAFGGPIAASFAWAEPKAALDELLAGLAAEQHGEIFSEEFRKEYLRPELRAWSWPSRKVLSAKDFMAMLYARGGWVDPRYTFADYKETLKTPQGKFVMPRLLAEQAPEAALFASGKVDYPYELNLFQPLALMNEFSANLPYLQEIAGTPEDWPWDSYVEINPKTAQALGIAEGDWVMVQSPAGRFKTRARLFAGAMPSVISLPLGQGHKALGKWARNRGVYALDLLANGATPRVSVVKA